MKSLNKSENSSVPYSSSNRGDQQLLFFLSFLSYLISFIRFFLFRNGTEGKVVAITTAAPSVDGCRKVSSDSLERLFCNRRRSDTYHSSSTSSFPSSSSSSSSSPPSNQDSPLRILTNPRQGFFKPNFIPNTFLININVEIRNHLSRLLGVI